MPSSKNCTSTTATTAGSAPAAHDLFGAVHGLRLHGSPVVGAQGVEPGVPGVEVGLEDLHALAGDDRAPYPPDQLLALPGEHDPGDHFDATGASTVLHV